MRALILEEPGRLVLKEVATPTPGPGELLVRVAAATTCGTDLKAFLRGHPQIPMPGPLGHEYSGTVEASGGGASFSAGQQIMGVHSAPCGHCLWCTRGQENLCESIMSTKVLGTYAEYLLIPERIAKLNVFEKPQDLSFPVAALLEPLACVAQGVLELVKVGALPASNALVIGPGAIGLMFVAALKLAGVERVVLAGRNPARLEVGASMGAESVQVATLQPPSPGFDIVVECTGQVEIWERSVDFSRRGGHVMLFGGCASGTRVSFDTGRLHYDQITLLSPFHFGTQAVRDARSWLIQGQAEFEKLISGACQLEDADEVFANLRSGKGIKYVFQP